MTVAKKIKSTGIKKTEAKPRRLKLNEKFETSQNATKTITGRRRNHE